MLVKQHMSCRLRGFTLTEAAIVLGIMGLILGAIWSAASAVYKNQHINTTSAQILQIVNGVRSLYSTRTIVESSVTAAVLKSAGSVPSDMETNGIYVKNVWGGNVEIFGNDTTYFSIRYYGLPDDVCAKLLVGLTGVNRYSGLILVDTGGGSSINSASFPVTVTTAVSMCSMTSNIVLLRFNLHS